MSFLFLPHILLQRSIAKRLRCSSQPLSFPKPSCDLGVRWISELEILATRLYARSRSNFSVESIIGGRIVLPFRICLQLLVSVNVENTATVHNVGARFGDPLRNATYKFTISTT